MNRAADVPLGGSAGGAVVYEVTLDMDAAIADAYRAWLQAHMREMLTLPGFVGARLCQPLPASADRERVVLCVQYTLRDPAALDDYLRDHAARLRAEGLARFGDRVQASRRVLRVLDQT